MFYTFFNLFLSLALSFSLSLSLSLSFFVLSAWSIRSLDHQTDHNLALHTQELPIYALLGALRRQFEGDTPILKLINEIIDCQCQLCGSLFPNFLEKNRHASGVCLLR